MESIASDKATILIVDDTPANIGVLLEYLDRKEIRPLVAESGEMALQLLDHCIPDLILLDIMMPGIDGYETCERLKQNEKTRDIPVIFMTALNETENKVKGFRAGAVDYVTKPFQNDEVWARVKTHLTLRNLQLRLEDVVKQRTSELEKALQEVEKLKDQLKAENAYLLEEIKRDHNFEEIIGNHPALVQLLDKVEMVAKTDSTVLINGESGTGKELIARAIHSHSPLREKALVKVNCGAISPNLVESELFGHEKGAFTGATSQRAGRFELANGGTIFLDEVGELPADTQVKLLRVLQEQEFERVGGTKTIKVSVRVIAATNRDLAEEVRKGKFRSDLFYRLNVFPVVIPPLRQRSTDVPLLTDYFLQKYARKLGKQFEGVTEKSMQRMISYSWPGNIRELQNAIERAAIISPNGVVEIDIATDHSLGQPGGEVAQAKGLDQLEDIERDIIIRALEQANWQVGGKNGAAELLDRPASTIRDRMKKLGIDRRKYAEAR